MSLKIIIAKVDFEVYDTSRTRRKSKSIMDLLGPVRGSTIARTYDSFRNPRLENNAANYLSPKHVENIKNDATINVWDEYKQPLTIPGVGTLRRIGIQTQQGYTYDTLVGIPETQTSDVPVIGTTAWTTSLRGHNEHVIRNLVRDGNIVMFVGAEGSFVHEKNQEHTSPISLANSAAAVLNFSYHMANGLRKDGLSVDEENRICIGESRGGMIAEGIDALAAEFAQHIVFSDQIAPCLPKRLESAHELLRLAEQVVKEPAEMYRLIGSLTLSRLKHYPSTVDIRLECIRNQLQIGGALFSGETGALSLHTPDTTLKHITVFDNDFASNRSWWEERYLNNPLVRITPLRGGHMTIADLETITYIRARNIAAQEYIRNGAPLDQSLFDYSHEIVAKIERNRKNRSHPFASFDQAA